LVVLLFSWRSVGTERVVKQSSLSRVNSDAQPSPSRNPAAARRIQESKPQAEVAPEPPRPAQQVPAPMQLRNTEIPPQDNVIPALWHDSDSDLFTARIYPSMRATAKPLARKLSGKLRTHRPGGGPDEPDLPTEFRITSNQLTEQHRRELRDEFTEQLRKEFADAKITVVDTELLEEGATELELGVVRIVLQIKNVLNEGAAWDSDEQERGVHVCRAETSGGDILAECEYIEKPWLENFDVFVSRHPSKRFVVGYSTAPASSEDEARRLAMSE
jgi:hypothetical protein